MSPVTLKVDHPDFPDDYEFGVSELGRVKNHGTLEVDDDALKAFETSRGMSIAQAFHGNAVITLDGAEPWTPPKEEQEQQQEQPVQVDQTPPQQSVEQQLQQTAETAQPEGGEQ